jgi:hypothetical protein
MTDPTTVATAWMDRAWDADAGLLWNAPGAFDDVTDGPRTVHLVRETAWYALGLLRRAGPGDAGRAARALQAVCEHQYDEPGAPWHGSFVRFPEWPAPQPGAVEWVDYDPNWRQFLGSALAVAVTDFELPQRLVERCRTAVALAVDAEPPDRVPPTYANIALLRAWLEAWSGRTDLTYAASVVREFERHGCFVEHNSPTYYGIDLLALGLWQRGDAPPALQRWGAAIESALWRDIGRWWHPGLGNLCGPYSRAYGMDLHTYVSGLGLARWCAGLPAALPDLGAEPLPHGHDLCAAPLLQHVGVRVPADARSALSRFTGPHLVEQVVQDAPRRVATGWLGDDRMVGAESGAAPLHARGQYHPATVHWRRPDGAVGWLRLVHHAPTRATASEDRLEVELDPHPRHGPVEATWTSNTEADAVSDHRWTFPGLTVEVRTDGHLTAPSTRTYTAATHMTLTLSR